jgi:hypothetical protein
VFILDFQIIKARKVVGLDTNTFEKYQAWEQIELIETAENKISQFRWNGRNLQVQESGFCAFANHNQELWEKFDVEIDKNGNVVLRNKFFVSILSQDFKNLNHKYS